MTDVAPQPTGGAAWATGSGPGRTCGTAPSPISLVIDGPAPQLRGSRCSVCAEVVFPPLLDCPLCLRRDSMQPMALRGLGLVDRYTVAERGPEGFDVRYIRAWVRLHDGPLVFSMLTDADPRDLRVRVGSEVTMGIAPIGAATALELGWVFRLNEVRP
jgi:uncharacterized OB-fold protein